MTIDTILTYNGNNGNIHLEKLLLDNPEEEKDLSIFIQQYINYDGTEHKKYKIITDKLNTDIIKGLMLYIGDTLTFYYVLKQFRDKYTKRMRVYLKLDKETILINDRMKKSKWLIFLEELRQKPEYKDTKYKDLLKIGSSLYKEHKNTL